MKLEVKYIFPASSFADFYIYELPDEGLGMRKILAHGTRMQKNPQTKEDIFWIFTDFHEVMCVQSPTSPPYRNFVNGIANPKIICSLGSSISFQLPIRHSKALLSKTHTSGYFYIIKHTNFLGLNP